MNVRELVRPEIAGMQAYLPASADEQAGIRLDNNESPWPAPGVDGDIHRYPPQPPRELAQRMARYYGVGVGNVLPTRGSDDAIDALIRCFCRPGLDAVEIVPPTFAMYATFARLNGVPVIETPLGADFELPLDALCESRGDVRLTFLCSPNNPTGKAIDNDVVAKTCKARTGLVVVDEAYAEFMQQPSAVELLRKFGNLVVLRTLSKGLALAGARVGTLLASPDVIEFVRRVLPPYPLPTPSVFAAEQALADGALEITRKRIADLLAERERVAAGLHECSSVRKVHDSDANFLLVSFDDASAVFTRLESSGIRVRAFNDTRLRDCLRIGIGSPAENRALLAALGATA